MQTPFWDKLMEKLSGDQKRIPVLFSLIRQLSPIEETDERIILGCANQGMIFYLEKRRSEIEQEIYSYIQKKINVIFAVGPPKKKNSKKNKIEDETPLLGYKPTIGDIVSRAGLNPYLHFDNFAVSTTNQVAYAAAQAVGENPGRAYNPLFLWGGVGVGKTHLAQSIGRRILEENAEKKVYFAPGDQFTNELIEAIRERNTTKFRKKYRPLNLLIIDDVQFIGGKDAVQEEFFHTFNSIVGAGGQIVITADKPPHEIRNLEDRLRSRFSGGLIVDIQPPDFELRTAILLIKAQEKKINLEIEAAKIIAEYVTDTRALEGTLLSIYAKTLGVKNSVDVGDAEVFFNQAQVNPIKRKVSPHDVIKAVCLHYNVKQSHIKGATRDNNIVFPRQITMYLLRNELKLKLEEVAYILKRKDHTTIMHGVEKIQRLRLSDENIKKEIEGIVQNIFS